MEFKIYFSVRTVVTSDHYGLMDDTVQNGVVTIATHDCSSKITRT